MNPRRPPQKVTLRRGHRFSKYKWPKTIVVASNRRSFTKAEQILPDTAAIPWLGISAQG